MKKYTKNEVIRIVTDFASAYSREFENKSLLFICIDKNNRVTPIEFHFHDYNFLHLTGLVLTGSEKPSAKRFYEKCLNHKLKHEDFDLSPDGTTQLKLEILPLFVRTVLKASIVGDIDSLRPKLYTEKIAGGVKACVGFVADSISGQFVPNTFLKEDIRNVTRDRMRVVKIFRKSRDDDKYSECTYTASKVDWSKIVFPDEYSYLHSELEN